jgi:hypothetical protein
MAMVKSQVNPMAEFPTSTVNRPALALVVVP